MRVANVRIALLSLVVVLSSTVAFAQSAAPPPAMPACSGDITIVRVSTIKPGMMDAFMKAQEAHKAWYKSHGLPNDQIYSSRVLVQDPATKAWKYSDTEVMAFHVSTSPTDPKHDAAWDAYVKQYRDSSDIKSTTVVCLPKAK